MVSVIIPNYNHTKYFDKRLVSVLNQTYQEFEVIILDDCSTDNSRDIIEKYRNNPKVSAVVYNEVNSGSPFRQWKKGIELAKGEYIWIAESDDVASTNFLERMMPFIQEYQASLIFCDSKMIDEMGNDLTYSWTDQRLQTREGYVVFEGNFFLKEYMLKRNNIYNASAVLFKKDNVSHIQEFLNYQYAGDWFFWCNIAFNSSVVYLNEKLNYFRQHSQKVSPESMKKGLSFFEGLDVIHYLMDILAIPGIQKTHIGVYHARKIKSDPYISTEVIRDGCMRKCKMLFPYLTIGQIVFFIPDIIIPKALAFVMRIWRNGFLPAMKYYLVKYF
jgi:glycosyltransferase involved in cell wall biosynthesis